MKPIFRIPRRSVFILGAFLLAGMTLSACDSGGDEDDTPEEELAAMNVKVQSALTVALTPTVSKAAEVLDLRNCPEGGQVDVTTVSSDTALSYDMDFMDCNGIDGMLSLRGSGSFDGSLFVYDFSLNGNLEERCEISYNNYRQRTVTDIQSSASTITLNGNISATCSTGSTSCSFNNVEIDAQSTNEDAFSEHCN